MASEQRIYSVTFVEAIIAQNESLRLQQEPLREVAFAAERYMDRHKQPYETSARRKLRKTIKDWKGGVTARWLKSRHGG